MLTPRRTFMLVLAVPLAACAPDPTTYPTGMDMTTWSIVGIDPKTGDVSVAVASCVTRQGGVGCWMAVRFPKRVPVDCAAFLASDTAFAPS